jgi:hypothetical protein
MARAIQDSINGIIVMSLVSMMNQFELSEQDAAGERPELEKLEAQDNRKSLDEDAVEGDSDAVLPARIRWATYSTAQATSSFRFR